MKKMILKLLHNYLAILSKLYLSKTNTIVIGITGSVGKTSCRMIIYQILKKILNDKKVYSSPKNFNSEIGLPFSIFEIENFNPSIFYTIKKIIYISIKAFFLKPNYDILILEYGIDKPGDMDLLLKNVKPNIAIFTKLDSIHIEFFNNVEEIGFEKFKLIYKAKKKVYLNYQDNFAKTQFNKIKVSKSYYFGKDIESKNYNLIKEKNTILSKFEVGNKTIKTNLLGEENAQYIALAFDILDTIGEENNKQKKEVYLDLELQAGRFSIFSGIKKSILIDSSYNAGPESMKKMIENTFIMKEKIFPKFEVILVLGEMRELGKYTKKHHKELTNYINNPSIIITIGKEMKNYFIPEMKKNKKEIFLKSFLSSKEAGFFLKNILEKNNKKYIILFKGSQNTIFTEEALKKVLARPNDIKYLVRQSDFWIRKKESFFDSLT